MKTIVTLFAGAMLARLPITVSPRTFDMLVGLLASLVLCAFVGWIMLMMQEIGASSVQATTPHAKAMLRRTPMAHRSTLPAKIANVLSVTEADARGFPISSRAMPAIAL